MVALVLLFQNHFSPSITKGPLYKFFNEFVASVAWVVWALENITVFTMWSRPSGFLILGLRLFFGPFLLRQAYFNPCVLVFKFLIDKRSQGEISRNGGPFILLLAQLVAVPVGIAVHLILWTFLAKSALSEYHDHFLSEEVIHFLRVPILVGFIIETFLAFLMFLPGLYISQVIPAQFTGTLFSLLLIFIFGPWTGALMNPIVALSFWIMWHYGSVGLWTTAVHVFVYWAGPMTGAAMAAGVARFMVGTKQHME